jgi:hypothetical protein
MRAAMGQDVGDVESAANKAIMRRPVERRGDAAAQCKSYDPPVLRLYNKGANSPVPSCICSVASPMYMY